MVNWNDVALWLRVPLEIAKNTAILLPPVRTRALRRHTTGLMDRDASVDAVYRFIRQWVDVTGATVIDLGPGQTLGLLRRAADDGAKRAIGLDIVDYAGSANDLRGVEFQLYDGSHMPLEDGSADALWTWDCLEHVRDPAAIVAEIARILRVGGRLICRVDIRDHLQAKDELILNNLSYPETVWNMMTWNRSAYTNRIRFSEWLDLFERYSLRTLHMEPFPRPGALRRSNRDRLLARHTEVDLVTTGFQAVLERT